MPPGGLTGTGHGQIAEQITAGSDECWLIPAGVLAANDDTYASSYCTGSSIKLRMYNHWYVGTGYDASKCEGAYWEWDLTYGRFFQRWVLNNTYEFTCENNETKLTIYESKPIPTVAVPTGLSCGTLPRGLLAVSVADPETVDVVDYELAILNPLANPYGLHSVSYTQVVGSGGVAKAEISNLEPGTEYKIQVRAHPKGQPDGVGWTALSEGVTCHTGPLSAVQFPSKTGRAERKSGTKTKWIEVYREPDDSGTDIGVGSLPDFLDNHDSADLGGWAGTDLPYPNFQKKLTGVTTRYCVEIADVRLPGTTTMPSDANGLSPWADYASCNYGTAMCMVTGDRMLSKQNLTLQMENCPVSSNDTTYGSMLYWTCETCPQETYSLTNWYTGKAPMTLPWGMSTGTEMTIYGEPAYLDQMTTNGAGAYPFTVNTSVSPVGHWISHPFGGRCPPGANVGDNGCTWQLAPQAFTRNNTELVDYGFDPDLTVSYLGGWWNIPSDLGQNNIDAGKDFWGVYPGLLETGAASSLSQKLQRNIEAGKKLFAGLPPCGSDP